MSESVITWEIGKLCISKHETRQLSLLDRPKKKGNENFKLWERMMLSRKMRQVAK